MNSKNRQQRPSTAKDVMKTNPLALVPAGAMASARVARTLCGAILISALAAHAVPTPAGVAPVTTPVGGFSIGGELVAGSGGTTAGDWMSGPGGVGVLDATGKPLNPATTFHFVDLYNSANDNVFTAGKWTDDPNTWTW